MEKDNKKHNTNTATKKPTTKENKTDNKKIDAIINNLQEISPTKRIGVTVGAAIFTGMVVKT